VALPTSTSASAPITTGAPPITIAPTTAPPPITSGALAGVPLASRACAGPPAGNGGSPPEPAPDAASVAPGGVVLIPVLANDGDLDGDLVGGSLALENAPQKGTVSLVDGAIQYVASPDANGADRFVYTILDATGACGDAPVTITIR
jgi:hypothetical protein